MSHIRTANEVSFSRRKVLLAQLEQTVRSAAASGAADASDFQSQPIRSAFADAQDSPAFRSIWPHHRLLERLELGEGRAVEPEIKALLEKHPHYHMTHFAMGVYIGMVGKDPVGAI